MKQVNVRHLNKKSKKFTVLVIFIQKEIKWAPERPIYYVYRGVLAIFQQLPIISRFLKSTQN